MGKTSPLQYRSKSSEIEIADGFSENLFFEIKPLVSTTKPIVVLGKYEMESGDVLLSSLDESLGEINDYFKKLPGAVLISDGGKTLLTLDGCRPEDVLIVVDGSIVPSDENGVRDISFLNPDNIKSIELQRSGIPAKYSSIINWLSASNISAPRITFWSFANIRSLVSSYCNQ